MTSSEQSGPGPSSTGQSARPNPERMRDAVAGYVQEVHRAYLAQALTFPPGVRGTMPLLNGGQVTVVAAATRNLHLLATHESLGPTHGPEVALQTELDGLSWQLRFYDSVVAPGLALIDETVAPAFEEVKHALGIRTVVYHFVAQPGAGLSGHQAAHVGTGLANGHSAVARDFETIRSRVRGREGLVDEMAGAATAGLRRAHALLAQLVVPHNADVAALAAQPAPDPDAVRKAVLASLGGRSQWTPPEPDVAPGEGP
jgi:hypothetical protein